MADSEHEIVSLTSYHLLARKISNKESEDTELNQQQISNQQQVCQIAKLPNPKQLNQQEQRQTELSQAQRQTQRPRQQVHQPYQPSVRQSSRERSQKTVAFGLTTNIEDTVEGHRQHRINTVNTIPTIQKTVRPSLSTNTTISAMRHQIEELQKELKCYWTQSNALRAENETLRKTTDELRDSLSGMTHAVGDLSSRLLSVEERITENSGVDKMTANRNRAVENAEKIAPPSITANVITAGVSAPLSTAIFPTTTTMAMMAAGEPMPSRRRIMSSRQQKRPSGLDSEIVKPKTVPSTSNASLCQASKTRHLMRLLENRIRERPELLHRMWSILTTLDDDDDNNGGCNRGSVMAPSIVTTNAPAPTAKTTAANTRSPLNERTQHRENLPRASNSPYSAKFTQKFTLEHEVFYSRQMDTHEPHHNQRHPNQHQQPSARYPQSAAADAEFFEEPHSYDEYDGYGGAKHTNATLMNASLLHEADETLARLHQPNEVEIRDRYRRRRL